MEHAAGVEESAPDYEHAGVPYALQGANLVEWIRDELESPPDTAVDWAKYLAAGG